MMQYGQTMLGYAETRTTSAMNLDSSNELGGVFTRVFYFKYGWALGWGFAPPHGSISIEVRRTSRTNLPAKKPIQFRANFFASRNRFRLQNREIRSLIEHTSHTHCSTRARCTTFRPFSLERLLAAVDRILTHVSARTRGSVRISLQ